MAKKKKPGRGGARPGGGRPKDPNAKVPVAYRLTQDVAEYLQTIENRSVFVDELVRKSRAFKQWQMTSETEKEEPRLLDYRQYFEQLKGSLITGVQFEDCPWGGDEIPVLQVSSPEYGALLVAVSSDREGNGAGFLHIQDVN